MLHKGGLDHLFGFFCLNFSLFACLDSEGIQPPPLLLVHDNDILLRSVLLGQLCNVERLKVVRLKDALTNRPIFTDSLTIESSGLYSFQMDTPAFAAVTQLRPNGQDKERDLHSMDKLVPYERLLKYITVVFSIIEWLLHVC